MEELNYDIEIKKVRQRKHNQRKMIVLVISLFAIVCVFGIFFLTKKKYDDLNTITYDNYELYQYFQGQKVTYNGKVKIERNNEITELQSQEITVETGDVPIYFQNIYNEVLFPEYMELVFLNNSKLYRLNYFAKVMNEEDEDTNNSESYLLIKDKKILLDESFLYNGDNLYFFPYKTILVVDGKEYSLSALSYVNDNYGGEIEIYDKKNDEYLLIEEHDSAIVKFSNAKIDLDADMLLYEEENRNRLLIKSVSKLEAYE